MSFFDIIDKVSKDTGLPFDIVYNTYKAFWLYIKSYIKELPLKEGITEEQFSNIKTNFNIPSLGKLGCIYTRYRNIKDRFDNINDIKKRNEKAD